jgi:hypothetical protein
MHIKVFKKDVVPGRNEGSFSHSYLEEAKFLVVLPGKDKEHHPSQSVPLTSECRVLEGHTFRMGASFSSRLEPECLRGGTGLMVCVMAREMGRSLSPRFSCMETPSKVIGHHRR